MLQFLFNEFIKSTQLKFYFMLLFFVVLSTMKGYSAAITTTGSGNWSSTTPNATWTGGKIPLSTDDINIGNGFTLTVDGNGTSNSVSFTAPASGTGTGILTVNSGLSFYGYNGCFISCGRGFNKSLKLNFFTLPQINF